MPATAAARLKEIRDFALSLPGTQPKSPWPGHDDVAVNDKTFLYLGLHDGEVSVGVKRRTWHRACCTPDRRRPDRRRSSPTGARPLPTDRHDCHRVRRPREWPSGAPSVCGEDKCASRHCWP